MIKYRNFHTTPHLELRDPTKTRGGVYNVVKFLMPVSPVKLSFSNILLHFREKLTLNYGGVFKVLVQQKIRFGP